MISRYFRKTSACRLWNPCFTLSDICQPFMIWKAIKYFALLTLLRIFSHDLPNDLILFLHKNRISYNLRCWAMHQMDAVRYWLFLKWTVKVVYPRPSCAHPSWHARHTFWDRVSQIWKIPKERNPFKQQWKDIYFYILNLKILVILPKFVVFIEFKFDGIVSSVEHCPFFLPRSQPPYLHRNIGSGARCGLIIQIWALTFLYES